MIRQIKTFAGLSASRKILIVQTLGLSIYTGILFSFFNRYARFGRKLGQEECQKKRTPPTIQQAGNQKVKDIAWAIKLADKYIPWKNVCRHQAHQALALCNYNKVSCFIFIGFKKDRETNEIQAHAWSVAEGQMITGFCNPEEYIVQSIYCNKWQ